MYRVTNLSQGRVQIRAAGRSTLGGKFEIVQSISIKHIRLKQAGLIEWEEVGVDLKPRPADAPTLPELAPPPPAAESPKSEVLPVTEAVEADDDDEAVEAGDDDDDDEAGDDDEAAPAPDDDADDAGLERVAVERARLEAADWVDIKAEAKDKGVGGRSRTQIVSSLIDLFASGLE